MGERLGVSDWVHHVHCHGGLQGQDGGGLSADPAGMAQRRRPVSDALRRYRWWREVSRDPVTEGREAKGPERSSTGVGEMDPDCQGTDARAWVSALMTSGLAGGTCKASWPPRQSRGLSDTIHTWPAVRAPRLVPTASASCFHYFLMGALRPKPDRCYPGSDLTAT